MLTQFAFNNLSFKKHDQESWLMLKGEVTNNAGKNYNAVVFRVVLFMKSIPVGNITFVINGFINGQTRNFEQQIGELEYNQVIKEISKYEIFAESAY